MLVEHLNMVLTFVPYHQEYFEGMYKHILTEKGLQLFDKDYAGTIKDLEAGK